MLLAEQEARMRSCYLSRASAMAAAVVIAFATTPTRAADWAAGNTTLTSAQGYAQCRAMGDNPFFCSLVALFIDPPSA